MGDAARRAILKLIGMAPAAAPHVAASLAAVLPKAEALAAVGLIPQPTDSPAPSSEKQSPILGELQRLFNHQSEEENSLSDFRMDAIDPDIAALKSTSRAYKVARQRQRNLEALQLSWRARRLLWGDHW